MSLELLDYRHQVFSHYATVRNSQKSHAATAANFRRQRDELFSHHPQSAFTPAQKKIFQGIDYFPYDLTWKKEARLDFEIEAREFEIALKDDGSFKMKRLAHAHFSHRHQEFYLSLFWLQGYGGGLFLPFRDESRKSGETYGGSRYLLDTIKGADLGVGKRSITLDFNYAYNPSCAYNLSWDCPLAPEENWLDASVLAGEKSYPHLEVD